MKQIKQPLNDTELRLVAELMKNSRRSDRELAKAVGVSQPTISRTIAKLEKRGVIREYTMIPDFHVLGYEIMACTGFELREEPFDDRAKAREKLIDAYPAVIAVEGISRERNRLTVGFYKDYGEYTEAMRFLKAIPIISVDKLDTFLVDLSGEERYRFMSMSALAKSLLKRLEKKD